MSHEPAAAPTVVRCLLLRRLLVYKTTRLQVAGALLSAVSYWQAPHDSLSWHSKAKPQKHVKELFPIPLFVVRETLLRGCKRDEVEAKVFSFNTLTTVHTFRFGFAKIQTFEILLYRFVPICTDLYPFVSFLFVIGLGSAIASQTTRLQVATV